MSDFPALVAFSYFFAWESHEDLLAPHVPFPPFGILIFLSSVASVVSSLRVAVLLSSGSTEMGMVIGSFIFSNYAEATFVSR